MAQTTTTLLPVPPSSRITGLTGTIPFYVRIRANGTPNGEYSAPSGPYSLVAATVPSMPQNVMASKTTSTEVTVTWSPPLNPGTSAGITSYEASIGTINCNEDASDGSARSATCNVTDVPAYTVSVVAVNSEGSSAAATFVLEEKLSTSNLHAGADIVSDSTTGGGLSAVYGNLP